MSKPRLVKFRLCLWQNIVLLVIPTFFGQRKNHLTYQFAPASDLEILVPNDQSLAAWAFSKPWPWRISPRRWELRHPPIFYPFFMIFMVPPSQFSMVNFPNMIKFHDEFSQFSMVPPSQNHRKSQDRLLPLLRGQRLRCRCQQRSPLRWRLDGLDGQLWGDGHRGRCGEGRLRLRQGGGGCAGASQGKLAGETLLEKHKKVLNGSFFWAKGSGTSFWRCGKKWVETWKNIKEGFERLALPELGVEQIGTQRRI